MLGRLLLFVLFSTFIVSDNNLCSGEVIHIHSTTQSSSAPITLDTGGKYLLSWEVDLEKKDIVFEVVAETTGYVGFGISPGGQMDGADIFVAGVDVAGKPYSSDQHGVGNTAPVIDDHQDWNLLEASENETHTHLKFSRLLNTCDDQDYVISEDDTTRVIWATGRSDTIGYHAERGSASLNLIETSVPEVDISQFDKWEMTVNMTMPSYDTSYWCTFHKRPDLPTHRHIIGFDVYLENAVATQHTHHFIVYKCYAPDGQTNEETFARFVGEEGQECYPDGPRTIPSQHCPEYLFVWASGGKVTLFPENVGYSIAESADENPYYMMEVHYDNPRKESGVTFESGVQIFHTETLREQEAGMLVIGLGVGPELTIPPNTKEFILSGHCPSMCTDNFPEDGISAFNILLHSHLSGRKLRLRHFRKGVELPWILSDVNYDFNYQQNKALTQEVKIMPGDHVTYECNYDTTWKNGEVVLGGLSTRDEMCQSFIWYYPRMKVNECAGRYPRNQNYLDFGITNYTWQSGMGIPTTIVLAPEELKGLDYSTVLNTKINWTAEFIAEQQEKRRFGEQDHFCTSRTTGNLASGKTKYPEFLEEYVPDNLCDRAGSALVRTTVIPILFAMLAVFSFH